MPRVKRSVAARKKRRKVLGQAKGYWGLKKSSYKYAKEQVDHSLTYAYRDRKNKKRTFRRLWIMRINAGARANGLSYNQFIAGLKKSSYRYAKEQVDHSLTYAYRDRKNKKRTFRRLWIMRINAAARREGLSYNQLVAGLRKAEIPLDRKVLADLAVSDPEAFGKIAAQAKAALEG